MFGSKKKKEQERDEEEKPFNWKKEVIEWVSLIFFTILFVTFLDTKVVVNSVVPSASMETTIMTGDHIFGNRLAYRKKDPERFDIVIFRMPDDKSELYIKRIIGLPGETVRIEDGEVYINDSETPLRDDFIREPMKGEDGIYQVPENSYFMMGDNRNNSSDSRFWNNPYVIREDILGKAFFRYLPFDRIGPVE